MRGPARYLPFTRNVFKRSLAYRGNFFFFLLGNLVQTVILFYLWRAIFTGSGSAVVNGFTFPQMFVYLLLSVATSSAVSNRATQLMNEEIRDGSIAIALIRPLNYSARVLFDSLGTALFRFLMVSLPALAIAVWVCAAYGDFSALSLAGALLYLPSLILAYGVSFFFSYLFGLSTIIFTNLWGMAQIMNAVTSLFSGALIPLAFFPGWAKGAIELLPFASLLSTPVLVIMGKLQGAALVRSFAVQAAWVLILGACCSLGYRGLIKRLTVQGG